MVASDLSPSAVPIGEIDWSVPTAVVLGNEERGISDSMRNMADATFVIPMRGFVRSFNMSVACSIILAHLSAVRYLLAVVYRCGGEVRGNFPPALRATFTSVVTFVWLGGWLSWEHQVRILYCSGISAIPCHVSGIGTLEEVQHRRSYLCCFWCGHGSVDRVVVYRCLSRLHGRHVFVPDGACFLGVHLVNGSTIIVSSPGNTNNPRHLLACVNPLAGPATGLSSTAIFQKTSGEESR